MFIYRLQYRHDVLIKFFNLMQQHSDDLGRLIVRSTSSRHLQRCLTAPLDSRKRETSCGGQGNARRNRLKHHQLINSREKMPTVLRSSRYVAETMLSLNQADQVLVVWCVIIRIYSYTPLTGVFIAEEAVRTYGGSFVYPLAWECHLTRFKIEQIPSPIPNARNVVIKQPIGAHKH